MGGVDEIQMKNFGVKFNMCFVCNTECYALVGGRQVCSAVGVVPRQENGFGSGRGDGVGRR